MLQRLDLRGLRGPALHSCLPRPAEQGALPYEAVRTILDAVRSRGDAALAELGSRFDGVRPSALEVAPGEQRDALARVDHPLRAALEAAADAIEAYHRHTVTSVPAYRRGGLEVLELRRAVGRAGCYVPGGRARYPSSLLMTAIPARVAGVEEVVVCVPPGPDGRIDDATLAAAAIVGVDGLYCVGGAQAIGAMAFGTETIRPVDVIAGPGNLYVAVAQREVAGVVGIASAFAGPSEVIVVADETANPRHVALDVAVQAEHGPSGLAWLVTWSEALAAAAGRELEEVVESSPRRSDLLATLSGQGYVALVDDSASAMEVVNAIAPEHLELMCREPESLLGSVRRAGAVFLGPWAPASVGDYIAGPSHVLPTFRSARFASVLGVEDFQTRIHAVSLDRSALESVGEHVVAIASAEGLDAHARSVSERLGVAGEPAGVGRGAGSPLPAPAGGAGEAPGPAGAAGVAGTQP